MNPFTQKIKKEKKKGCAADASVLYSYAHYIGRSMNLAVLPVSLLNLFHAKS